VKLTDLKPRRIHPCMFIFLCPHCREIWLACTTVPFMFKHQRELFEKEFGDDWPFKVVPANPDFAWTVSSWWNSQTPNEIAEEEIFMSLSVTPSIDASASGHWHGFITQGEIK